MSEENLQKPADGGVENPPATLENQSEATIELTINRSTNELAITDPVSGKTFKIKAKIIEHDDQGKGGEDATGKTKPLTVDEFRAVLREVDDLGLTWVAHYPTRPIFKKDAKFDESFREKYIQIQNNYPHFPQEMSSLIAYALLGHKQSPDVVGDEDTLKEKAALLHQTLLTREFRNEFFFKFAIKVPYFEDIDWEIVVKAFERGVKEMPKVAYALLSLTIRDPVDTTLSLEECGTEYRTPKFVTVAADGILLGKLITRLSEAKSALEKAHRVDLTEETSPEESSNESDSGGMEEA